MALFKYGSKSTVDYTALREDEEENKQYRPQGQEVPSAKIFLSWKYVTNVVPWVTTLFFAVLALILAKERYEYTTNSFATGWKTDFISARNLIEVSQIRFNGSFSFHENKTMFVPNPSPIQYVGDPTPEIDDNWEKLTWGRYILITEEEAKASWGEDIAEYWDESRGGYVAGLDIFHTLHCLNNIRKTFHPDYYNDTKNDPSYLMHQQHCIEQIRQFIMCTGDMTPIPTRYYPALGRNYVDSDQPHTCRNFEKLRDWMVDRYDGDTAIQAKPSSSP